MQKYVKDMKRNELDLNPMLSDIINNGPSTEDYIVVKLKQVPIVHCVLHFKHSSSFIWWLPYY